MKNTSLDNEFINFLKNSTFIKVLGVAGVVLTLTFGVQAYFAFTGAGDSATKQQDGATVRVNIGEMYFEQADSGLPQGELSAQVGDTIEFHNEGSLRHSVTIDEFDYDEVVYPGDTVYFTPDSTATDVTVNCKFHPGHDAALTVTEGEGGGQQAHIEPASSDVDTSQLPLRTPADSIERLEHEVVNGVKEFHLSAEHIMWEYAEGHTMEAWAYEGQLPAPEIRVTEGDEVRIVFTNNLPVATSVHWHGIDVPNEADGVPGVTQDPIEPGETFTYEFTADPAGTRFYHSHGSHHGDEHKQMDMGLSGPFIIEPRDYQAPDREYTMVLGERQDAGIFPINGKVYPNPDIYEVTEGDRVRVRIINASSSTTHPMHLHGHQFEVVAVDGNPVPLAARQMRNNLPLTPGETYDIEFTANNPGVWMFHCHELHHAAGGMIAEVHYQ